MKSAKEIAVSIYHEGKRLVHRITVCGRIDFAQAGTEVFVICLSAFLPLWAGFFFFSLARRPGLAEKYAFHFMTSGEMLLIACAMIGPLIYILSKKYGKLADPLTFKFPYSTGFSVAILIFWFITGCIFIAKKAGEFYGVDILEFEDSAIWNVSFAMTVITIALLFYATALRNFMDRIDPSRVMHDDQEQFVKDYDSA